MDLATVDTQAGKIVLFLWISSKETLNILNMTLDGFTVRSLH